MDSKIKMHCDGEQAMRKFLVVGICVFTIFTLGQIFDSDSADCSCDEDAFGFEAEDAEALQCPGLGQDIDGDACAEAAADDGCAAPSILGNGIDN